MLGRVTKNSYSTLLHYHICLIHIIYSEKVAGGRHSSPSTLSAAPQPRPPLPPGATTHEPPHAVPHRRETRQHTRASNQDTLKKAKGGKKKKGEVSLTMVSCPRALRGQPTRVHPSPQPLGATATAGGPRPGLAWKGTLILFFFPPQPGALSPRGDLAPAPLTGRPSPHGGTTAGACGRRRGEPAGRRRGGGRHRQEPQLHRPTRSPRSPLPRREEGRRGQRPQAQNDRRSVGGSTD